MLYTAIFYHRVKSYELDIYGHVNNAVYMNWLEHGRSQILQDKGYTYLTIADAWNVRLVTLATTINYRSQLGLADSVCITTKVKKFGRTSVTFSQNIYKTPNQSGIKTESNSLKASQLVCDGETTICFTDPEMKAAKPIPTPFRELYAPDLPFRS